MLTTGAVYLRPKFQAAILAAMLAGTPAPALAIGTLPGTAPAMPDAAQADTTHVDAGLQRALHLQAKAGEAERIRIAQMQVLFDRAGISPGVIDGVDDAYFSKAQAAYLRVTDKPSGFGLAGGLDQELAASGGDAFGEYQITESDVAGPFVAHIPERIQDQTGLRRLSYLRVSEALAERFHMDEEFLKYLNPDADFTQPGTVITVARTGRDLDRRVERVVASRDEKLVRAYAGDGSLVAVYPASIGSADNPSPHGTFTVRNKAANPFYTLSHENTFELVSAKRNFRIAPGPNNPVGTAWIGLSERTYGIHGTPEPSRIGRAESHGCIRLTNWDAMELARLLHTGVEVVIE